MKFSEAKHSITSLGERQEYAADHSHSNHEGIEISGPFCSNCASATDFLDRVASASDRYRKAYPNLRGPMPKPGAEMVLASKGNANVRAHEGEALIRQMHGPFPDYPSIYWIHDNRQRARTDYHVLIGNHTLSTTPTYRLHRFGHGKKDYVYYMQRLIEDTIDEINDQRWQDNEEPLEYWTDSVLANRLQRGWMPLGLQLFLLGERVTAETLFVLIERLGHTVLGKSVSGPDLKVQFKGQESCSTLDLSALLLEAKSPVIPRFRYRSRTGKFPAQLLEGKKILEHWRHRAIALQHKQQGKGR